MPGRPRILIVGAGIAGLALAASLERFGIIPVVVEAGDASLSRGLALMLTSNVAVALRRVDLDAVVVDQGMVLERIVHADPSGTAVEDDLDLARRMSDMRLTSALPATASCLACPAGCVRRFATQRPSPRWTVQRGNWT